MVSHKRLQEHVANVVKFGLVFLECFESFMDLKMLEHASSYFNRKFLQVATIEVYVGQYWTEGDFDSGKLVSGKNEFQRRRFRIQGVQICHHNIGENTVFYSTTHLLFDTDVVDWGRVNDFACTKVANCFSHQYFTALFDPPNTGFFDVYQLKSRIIGILRFIKVYYTVCEIYNTDVN